ncbi:MAG: hypothetical protein A3J28_06680 [Acidobacteria bacterium RIFCSPLOWO2_12_FULL_60_22]|nr:MAG: hypothetical protein A3J28_06680 [Acidobacteria bacterium RIFCSPLOWO2_12_FULL_60_22]
MQTDWANPSATHSTRSRSSAWAPVTRPGATHHWAWAELPGTQSPQAGMQDDRPVACPCQDILERVNTAKPSRVDSNRSSVTNLIPELDTHRDRAAGGSIGWNNRLDLIQACKARRAAGVLHLGRPVSDKHLRLDHGGRGARRGLAGRNARQSRSQARAPKQQCLAGARRRFRTVELEPPGRVRIVRKVGTDHQASTVAVPRKEPETERTERYRDFVARPRRVDHAQADLCSRKIIRKLAIDLALRNKKQGTIRRIVNSNAGLKRAKLRRQWEPTGYNRLTQAQSLSKDGDKRAGGHSPAGKVRRTEAGAVHRAVRENQRTLGR